MSGSKPRRSPGGTVDDVEDDESDFMTMPQSQFLKTINTNLTEVLKKHNVSPRTLFEFSNPTTQCFNTIGDCIPRKSNQTEEQGCKCWICGLPIYLNKKGEEVTVEPTMSNRDIEALIKRLQKDKVLSPHVYPAHCEHILPVMQAHFILGGLYDSDFKDLPKEIQENIQKNYEYAHPPCNLVKKNDIYNELSGEINDDALGELIDSIFLRDNRSIILNKANRLKYGDLYIIKSNGLAQNSPGYKEFREERVEEMRERLEIVLLPYKEKYEKNLFGLLLLSGVTMARENLNKYIQRLKIRNSVLTDKRTQISSLGPYNKKATRAIEELGAQIQNNNNLISELEGVQGQVAVEDEAISDIPINELLTRPDLDQVIRDLNASITDTSPDDIINQLSLMNQAWLIYMFRPVDEVKRGLDKSNLTLTHTYSFLQMLLNEQNLIDLMPIPRSARPEEGISARYIEPAISRLIELTITTERIESIIVELKGYIELYYFVTKFSKEDDIPLVQAREYIISLINSIYLIILLLRFNKVLTDPLNPAIQSILEGTEIESFITNNSAFNELISKGQEQLQQNLYNSLLSVFILQPHYKIKCLSNHILEQQIQDLTVYRPLLINTITPLDLLSILEFIIPTHLNKNIEIPSVDGTGTSTSIDHSLKDIIAITKMDGPYCHSETQEKAEEIMTIPVKKQLDDYLIRSTRLKQAKQVKEEIAAFNEYVNDSIEKNIDSDSDSKVPPLKDQYMKGSAGWAAPIEKRLARGELRGGAIKKIKQTRKHKKQRKPRKFKKTRKHSKSRKTKKTRKR